MWKSKVRMCLLLLSTLMLTTVITADKQQQLHHSKNHNHHHNNHHQHQHQSQQHQNHKRSEQQEQPLRKISSFYKEAGNIRLIKPTNVTTRLRPLNARGYYHKALERRLHLHQPRRAQQTSERDYHAYNVQNNNNNNNNYGNTINSRAGKGDDNTQDVEFISVTTATTPKWPSYTYNTRRFGGSSSTTTTIAPPALVPAMRGYSTSITSTQSSIISKNDAISTPITEGPLETNTQASRSYPPYNAEEMERRHICVQQRVITMPVKTTEIYTRPIWKHISTPCQSPAQSNQMCTRVQVVHEHAYRDVIRHKSAQSLTYDCCTGWTRDTQLSESCLKPICSTRCQNGGTCTGPDSCSCTSGYTGRHCELDINECQEEKPCDQTCVNTMGSYHCRCREGFVLQADRQSCKKTSIRDEDAFEARDLENEVDMGGAEVSARLHKIERSLENERVQTHELKRSLQSTYNVVDTLKSRLSTLEKQQIDVNRLQTKYYATETRTNKLEGMLNLLIKCRNGPNANCP